MECLLLVIIEELIEVGGSSIISVKTWRGLASMAIDG
jgi:hypothetical protein